MVTGNEIECFEKIGGHRAPPSLSSSLDPCRGVKYILTVFKGFRRVVRENVVLQVAEKIRVDFTLEPGTLTQTVEVRGASPLLQPETSSIGSVIAESTILGLPLEGRNVYELVKLVPGTTPAFNYG